MIASIIHLNSWQVPVGDQQFRASLKISGHTKPKSEVLPIHVGQRSFMYHSLLKFIQGNVNWKTVVCYYCGTFQKVTP